MCGGASEGCVSGALSALHDSVLALIDNDQWPAELDGFRFNEAALLPLQTMLCLDACQLETQVF